MYLSQEASQAYDPYGGFLQSYHDGSYGGAYGDGQFFGSYGSQYYPTQFSGDSTFTQMATLYFNYVQDMEKLKWCKYRVAITGWDNLSKQLRELAPDRNVKPEHLLLCCTENLLGIQKTSRKKLADCVNNKINKFIRIEKPVFMYIVFFTKKEALHSAVDKEADRPIWQVTLVSKMFLFSRSKIFYP
uniref:Uncharacterized protein n=1 Tax=Acrobeloides nanus TaxID=290746 RepID=A0A914E726_9BILA